MILERINQPNDIKKIDRSDYDTLAAEIRRFLVDKVSKTGGHLAPNLGVVELTMAIHLVLDFPKDKVIWDVGHQSYTHKILTGRRDEFDNLRKFGHMSGFPKRSESDCDAFNTGHSSTAISAGLGLAQADLLRGGNSTIISVVGDGALTGGMAFEALNNVSELDRNFIIILNDNTMSISKNVGGMSAYLNNVRVGARYNNLKGGIEDALEKIPTVGTAIADRIRKTKNGIKRLVVPGAFFEDLDIAYIGPIDGHDVESMVRILNGAKKLDKPVLVHVLTKKGMGYAPAEKNPSKFHGIGPFDKRDGKTLAKGGGESWTEVASKALVQAAKTDERIVAVTAAMPDGTGMFRFREKYPDRFFDVGIAEEHAVTFSAGLAAGGLKPYFAVYSSFLQRGFDQVLHDVCIQELPVTFLVDRAGITGADGETHHGIFDVSFLSIIPNMTIIAPSSRQQLEKAIKFSVTFNGPLAIRYGRGQAFSDPSSEREIAFGKSEMISHPAGSSCGTVIAVGGTLPEAKEAVGIAKSRGIGLSLVDAVFVKPIDKKMIDKLCAENEFIFTVEENELRGGYGEEVLAYVSIEHPDTKVICIGIDDAFVPHGGVDVLKKEYALDSRSIAERIVLEIKKERQRKKERKEEEKKEIKEIKEKEEKGILETQ